MPRFRIRALHIAVISAIALVVIVIVAVADHRAKQHRIRRASVASWLCTHRGLRCNEETAEAIGDRWHTRERIYQVSVALVLAIGAASVLVTASRSIADAPDPIAAAARLRASLWELAAD